MFGAKNVEEFVSLAPWDTSPERQPDGRASAEKASEMIEGALREGSQNFEWTHRQIGGLEFPADVLLTRVGHGEKAVLHATVRDITERRQAGKGLRESEERLRQVVETIHEVFWITDLTGHRMVYVSPGYEAIWGRSCESLYASPGDWVEAIHPEDRNRVLNAFGTQAVFGTYNEEYRIKRPDGGERWIRDRGFPAKDGGGAAYRIVGVAAICSRTGTASFASGRYCDTRSE